MKCNHCGTENADTSKFCKGCGTKLQQTQPQDLQSERTVINPRLDAELEKYLQDTEAAAYQQKAANQAPSYPVPPVAPPAPQAPISNYQPAAPQVAPTYEPPVQKEKSKLTGMFIAIGLVLLFLLGMVGAYLLDQNGMLDFLDNKTTTSSEKDSNDEADADADSAQDEDEDADADEPEEEAEDKKEDAGDSDATASTAKYTPYVENETISSIMLSEGYYARKAMLYDVDQDGTEELFLLYTLDTGSRAGQLLLNIYTIKDGAVHAIVENYLYYEHVDSPYGYVAVVKKDDAYFITTYRLTGAPDTGAQRYGAWSKYELGDSLNVVEEASFMYTNGNEDAGVAYLDGAEMTYPAFLGYVSAHGNQAILSETGTDDGMPASDLYAQMQAGAGE